MVYYFAEVKKQSDEELGRFPGGKKRSVGRGGTLPWYATQAPPNQLNDEGVCFLLFRKRVRNFHSVVEKSNKNSFCSRNKYENFLFKELGILKCSDHYL